jgi:hypothetical protein
MVMNLETNQPTTMLNTILLTMIKHQILYISHNFCITQVSVGSDGLQPFTMFLVNGGGLGMQNKGYGQ